MLCFKLNPRHPHLHAIARKPPSLHTQLAPNGVFRLAHPANSAHNAGLFGATRALARPPTPGKPLGGRSILPRACAPAAGGPAFVPTRSIRPPFMSRIATALLALAAAALSACASVPSAQNTQAAVETSALQAARATPPQTASFQADALPQALPADAPADAWASAPANTWDSPAADTRADLLRQLSALAPDADPGVLALALEARACALASGHAGDARRLAVIDYSRPSSAKRLWVFDLRQQRLLHHEHVTHGSGSGENYATRFSNISGSHQTSLGLYRTAETYQGANGYSLRLDGLDKGFNDAARERAIVIHGAGYADPALITRQGRLGRSQGCPALRHEVASQVIDALKQDQLVFAYANDADWLGSSRHFGCQSGQSAQRIMAQARAAHGPRALQVASASPRR